MMMNNNKKKSWRIIFAAVLCILISLPASAIRYELPPISLNDPAEEATPAQEQPTTPAEQPSTPAEQPTTPAEQPSTPAAQPTTPAEQPTTPAVQPTTPAPQPTTPAPQPSAPSAPIELPVLTEQEVDTLPTRSASEVRSIVGDDVEIINIDGLEVPLEGAPDGFVYIPFVDVPAESYYTTAVAWAYDNDITRGSGTELTFMPAQICTRAQMVTFLWRAAGSPEPTGTASAFRDVAAGSFYDKAVAWAVENKITLGVDDGRFDPNGVVNRAQAVTFLHRAQGEPTAAAATTFADVGAGSYYEKAVQWAVSKGITLGTGDGFEPNIGVNRAMSVTFLFRAYAEK